LYLGLAGCERDRGDAYLADLKRRSRKIKRHVERETGRRLGRVEILVRPREKLAEIAVPLMRESLARIENGPRGDELEAEALASAEGAAEWFSAQVDRKGRILFPDPEEKREGLFWLLAEFLPRSEYVDDPRLLDVVLLHELIHVHQHRFLETPAFHESVRSRADILARRAVLEGHAEFLSRKIAPRLGLGEFYEKWSRSRTEPPARIKYAFVRTEHRVSAADLLYAYVQGEKFVAAMVEELGYEEAMRQIFSDPPSLAEVSRPEEYSRRRERSRWGPIAEDLNRWLARERGDSSLEVIALPMVRELAGDAAEAFREGFQLTARSHSVWITVVIADSDSGAGDLHRAWTTALEKISDGKAAAGLFTGVRRVREPDAYLLHDLWPSIGDQRRMVVREGPIIIDVLCTGDSKLEQSAERLARRAVRFLTDEPWREKWLEGDPELMKSKDPWLRLAAVSKMQSFLPDDDWEVRWLGRFCEARDETKSEEERRAILWAAIEDYHPAVVARGLRALTDLSLWYIPWPLLRKQLGHKEAIVRREAWAHIDSPSDAEDGVTPREALRLVTAALDDSDLIVRARAADCLGWLAGEPEVAAVYRKLLRDENSWIRSKAAIALSTYGPPLPELIPDLIPLLKDDPANAAEALADLGEAAKEALPHLREVLKGSEGRVEAAEAIWLIEFDPEPLFEVVRESVAEGRPAGIAKLGEMGATARPMVPEVEKALAHESRWVRATAAKALGKIGGKQAKAALHRRLEVEKDEKVIESIRVALGRLKD
jgi:HEAT repeat protein